MTESKVGLSGAQLVGSASLLFEAQAERLIRLGVPLEVVVDLFLGLTAALVARMPEDVHRTRAAEQITQRFAALVAERELALRTSPGGIVLPRPPVNGNGGGA